MYEIYWLDIIFLNFFWLNLFLICYLVFTVICPFLLIKLVFGALVVMHVFALEGVRD